MSKLRGAMSSPWGNSEMAGWEVPNSGLPASEAREQQNKEKFDIEVISKVNEILNIELPKLQEQFKPKPFESEDFTKIVKYFTTLKDISIINISNEKLVLEINGVKFSVIKD